VTAIKSLQEYIDHSNISQAIFQRLDDPDEDVRRSAIDALSALVSSDADVRQAIFQRLDDQNPQVQSSAIYALSALVSSDADVRQAIFQRLDDQNPQVRIEALMSLSRLEKVDVLEKDNRDKLANWLTGKFDERYLLVRSYGYMQFA